MNDNTPANDQLFRRMWAIEQAVTLSCAVVRAGPYSALTPSVVLNMVRDLASGLELEIDRGVERIPQPSNLGLGLVCDSLPGPPGCRR